MTSLGVRRRRHERPKSVGPHALLVRREIAEYSIAVFACLFAVAALQRFGPTFTLFAVIVAAIFLAAASRIEIYAWAVLTLAPLPSLGALIGRDFPLGLEPLNLLVALGLGIALVSGTRIVRPRGRLVVVIGINLALLLAAWLRTYGADSVAVADLALVVKPVVLVLGAYVVVSLIPREGALEIIAIGMTVALFVIEMSIVLQRVGVYQTTFQVDNLASLSIKQYGGIMLQGNVAGAFLAIFAIPAYVLLKDTGRSALGAVTLASAFPVLLITLARGAMVGFVASLLIFAALTNRRFRAIGLIAGLVLISVGFALTVGHETAQLLVERFQLAGADQNAQLSGRGSIWNAVLAFMSDDSSRWWIGGGLDAFRAFAERTIGNAFATHNGFLYALANGGIVMLLAFVALGVVSFQRLRNVPESVTLATRVAAVTAVAVSLTSDTVPYSPTVAWLWVLLAVADRFRMEPGTATPAPAQSPAVAVVEPAL